MDVSDVDNEGYHDNDCECDKHCKNWKNKNLVGVLVEISAVSNRLAKRLALLEKLSKK